MEQKKEDSFDKIANELDSTFDPEKEFNNEKSKIDAVKEKLVNSDVNGYTLEDVAYMELELKMSLEGLQRVMDTLEQEIKVGAKAMLYEVYSTLTNSKINAVKELRELRKIIVDIKLRKEKIEKKQPEKNVNVYNFNSIQDVLEASVANAKKKSSLNQIDANFKIEE
jgi:hypothetical protein